MGITPPEEIERQHAEACAIVRSRAPCAPRVDRGEVPLRWKERPTASASTSQSAAENGPTRATTTTTSTASPNPNSPYDEGEGVECSVDNGVVGDRYPDWTISSRGQVDVSPIVALISEGVNEPAAPAAPVARARSERPNPSNGFKKSSDAKKKEKEAIISDKRSSYPSTNLWNERNAAANNVKITRPSHDAWGIKKIVLVFCDDFLHTIYTLPWYQHDNNNNDDTGGVGKAMHAAIQPVLDVLGIEQSQMVRCLLAGLPPGVTIPVHHDTGEWVRHAHRVHVPVIVPDPDLVLFRCGLDEESMDRVDCVPGHVFEMNNQAKHAVTNAGTEYRVHLILDYVDHSFFQARKSQNCPVRRLTIGAGEVLTQTRRSIDRALEAGTRAHPHYLILGAQKAGTTSLYEYVNQHPWMVRARRRETHCLDWRWDGDLRSTKERRRHCLEFYHADAMRAYPSLVTGDSTPSYLLDYYRVIPRLKECFGHEPKLIIMTRDPIKRAVSHYVMVTSKDGSPEQMVVRGMEWRSKTLEEVFEEDVRNMMEDGLLPYWDAESKTVDRLAFDEFINSREEDEAWERYVTTRIPLGTGSYAPLARGLYALQCRQWFRSFARDKFLVMKLEDMSSSPLNDNDDPRGSGGGNSSKGAQWAVDRTMEHLGLPRFELRDVEKKNSREYDDPLEGREELRGWLQRFFAPHNERFGRMMVEEMGYDEGDWKDVWSCSPKVVGDIG